MKSAVCYVCILSAKREKKKNFEKKIAPVLQTFTVKNVTGRVWSDMEVLKVTGRGWSDGKGLKVTGRGWKWQGGAEVMGRGWKWQGGAESGREGLKLREGSESVPTASLVVWDKRTANSRPPLHAVRRDAEQSRRQYCGLLQEMSVGFLRPPPPAFEFRGREPPFPLWF